ncbi:hypothetical protein HanXRQr2_Chr11g0473181 [Helianthus annuus]|uniref:Uncharacterized protein n=1 Tax=Helianthus annuus TaxID=4232 RepID=A0A9K3HLD0_HELAN|nr:hypothetical protein HanXRQr2_Chr11g0473181 [Helianthus annuus]KAJ0873772.1 hypothetical protein HanPSC8_Chr11g0456301 [Helianthus annuus]
MSIISSCVSTGTSLTTNKIHRPNRHPVISTQPMHTRSSIIHRTHLPHLIKPGPSTWQHQRRINHHIAHITANPLSSDTGHIKAQLTRLQTGLVTGYRRSIGLNRPV